MRKSFTSALRAFTLRAQVPELALANLGAPWQSDHLDPVAYDHEE